MCYIRLVIRLSEWKIGAIWGETRGKRGYYMERGIIIDVSSGGNLLIKAHRFVVRLI